MDETDEFIDVANRYELIIFTLLVCGVNIGDEHSLWILNEERYTLMLLLHIDSQALSNFYKKLRMLSSACVS